MTDKRNHESSEEPNSAPPQAVDDARPDAWERFERAVDAALHTRPKHRENASGKKKKRSQRAPLATIRKVAQIYPKPLPGHY